MSEKSKNILLGVLIVGLVAMTVAYAALSTSLNISGTANVAATSWNVRIKGWALDASSTATATSTGTTSDSNNVTKISNFTATLNKPGDFVKYNFKIENAGTINAIKDSFNASLTVQTNNGTTQSPNWSTASPVNATAYGNITSDPIIANITCADDTTITAGNESGACSLTITYNQNATALNQGSHTAGENQAVSVPEKKVTFNASWIYKQ